MKRHLVFIFVFVAIPVFGYESILFQDIKTLTLSKGRLTRGRRSAPIYQTKCVGGDACNYFAPEVFSCKNIGTDDTGNVQWKCQAQMEDLYRLGRTSVSCEGYSFKGDQNVLQGSCGVEYTLHLTEKGKDRHLRQRQYSPGETRIRGPVGSQRSKEEIRKIYEAHRHQETGSGDAAIMMVVVVPFVMTLVVIIVVGVCVECCCNPRSSPVVRVVNSSPNNIPRAQTVYVETPSHRSSSGGFWDGYMTSSILSSVSAPRRINHHHHTTSYSSPSHSNSSWGGGSSGGGYSHSSSSYSSNNDNSNNDSGSSTYTSSGYGGSSSR